MRDSAIGETLFSLLKEEFGFKGEYSEILFEQSVFSKNIGFNATEFYEYIMCIEDFFHLYFSRDELYEAKAYTLNFLQNLIYKKLKKPL